MTYLLIYKIISLLVGLFAIGFGGFLAQRKTSGKSSGKMKASYKDVFSLSITKVTSAIILILGGTAIIVVTLVRGFETEEYVPAKTPSTPAPSPSVTNMDSVHLSEDSFPIK